MGVGRCFPDGAPRRDVRRRERQELALRFGADHVMAERGDEGAAAVREIFNGNLGLTRRPRARTRILAGPDSRRMAWTARWIRAPRKPKKKFTSRFTHAVANT